MTVNFKVAGTTFHPLPKDKGIKIIQECTVDDVPCATAQAILMPEPTNPYDDKAVAVYISLKDGEAFHLGYVPAKEPVKEQVTKMTLAKMLIKDYGQMGNYNPSFVITEITM